MAPMLLEHLSEEDYTKISIPSCSDPSVVVSENASITTKALWSLHGQPHSKRYSDPTLTSLGALVRHDSITYTGRKAFLYPETDDASSPYLWMTWDEFDNITETIALSYALALSSELRDANKWRRQPTIALLGRGISLEYFCTQLALQKLGLRVLLLAEANSKAALQHLMNTCAAEVIITDSRNAGVDVGQCRRIMMVEKLPESSSVRYGEVNKFRYHDGGDIWERHNFIIHSSGTTGMPKPVVHTNRSMMLIARMYRLFPDFHVENWFLLFPLYHIAGISIALSNLPNGQTLSFPPLAWPPSSSALLTAWKTLSDLGHPVDCVHCAPTLIENLVEHIDETGGDFAALRSLKVLQPGGAALSENLVKVLTEAGVNVKTTYGSSEIGPVARSIPHNRSSTKCYVFRSLYPDNPCIKMERIGENTYECIVYKGFELAAELWDGKPEDAPYRTNDVFIQDPPGSGFFRLQGRKDDTLVHSNGENTNGGSLQLDVQSASRIIHRALALGHSQPCVALLVEVKSGIDPESGTTFSRVWEVVQRINVQYPKHSQVSKSMIHILPKGSALPVTPKGNVRRKEAETLYASVISHLYAQGNNNSTTQITPSRLAHFIRTELVSLLNIPMSRIEDQTSFYELGLDSKLAICLRKSIASSISVPVSMSKIFEHPSISKLCAAIFDTTLDGVTIDDAKVKIFTECIDSIITKIETNIGSWPLQSLKKKYAQLTRHTILLTGATGSLGTTLLEILANAPSVAKIYAMVRGSDRAAKLRASFQARKLNPSILETGNVEVVNYCMRDPLLGLDLDTYTSLANEITIILHNAWKMDFNHSVADFEADCLFNTTALIRFAHAGRPKTMSFISSVTASMGTGQANQLIPELPIISDPTVSLTTGYAQSKYIVERITQTASARLNMDIKLLRVGQLCGHTRSGQWNTNEMWPIIFATSAHPRMRCIPTFEGKLVNWIPVDIAATTISDILLHHDASSNRDIDASAPAGYSVHNITNPTPIPWAAVSAMFRTSLSSCSSQQDDRSNIDIEEVPMTEWVARLNVLAEQGVDDIPGLRLLGFFEAMASGGDGGASKVFETTRTREMSRALRECAPFAEAWMRKSVEVWKEAGFLV